ncbi:MAG TPA: hypothetical protein VLQ93_01005, partial [Myxococcaceae bacterium]|nr:hypothetical protein [Myxococcaceae bacterium]
VGRGVGVDREGNAFVLANFRDTLDFGSGPLPGTTGNPSDVNLAVAKFSPEGTLLWVRVFGVIPGSTTGPANAAGETLAVDAEGNVVFLATFRGAVDFGGGPLVAGEAGGIALVKLDGRGRHLWSRLLRISGSFAVGELATDDRGHIALAGTVIGAGPVDFGTGPLVPPRETETAFLARFSPLGMLDWLHFEADHVSSSGSGTAADERGNLFLSGAIAGNLQLIPFVRKLSPQGVPLWTRYLEGANGVASDVDAHGARVVVTGTFEQAFFFRGERVAAEAPGRDPRDAFLVAFTVDGREQWARHFGREGVALSMDWRGGVVVTGTYEDGDTFGRVTLPGVPDSALNVYVTKLDQMSGRTLWARGFATESGNTADIAATREGESVTVGSFSSPMDFGSIVLSPNGIDVFVVRLAR